MWRVMCILLTICLLSAAVSAADEGTRLDLASVPEDWILLGEYAAGAGDLQVFSERLGVTVVVLKNYLFGTPTGGVQVNLVLTETEAEAQALEELFLGFHPPEMVGRSGRRVLELVTEQPALAELAKTALRFDLEGTSGADQAVLREYLKAWSWSVARWEDIASTLTVNWQTTGSSWWAKRTGRLATSSWSRPCWSSWSAKAEFRICCSNSRRASSVFCGSIWKRAIRPFWIRSFPW